MKKLLDALHVTLGTLCLFGLPSAALGLSAYFGDAVMAMLHTSASAMHSITFQIEAMVIVFGTSAGGLLVALAVFTGVYFAAQYLSRMARRLEPVPVASAVRVRVGSDNASIGRINRKN